MARRHGPWNEPTRGDVQPPETAGCHAGGYHFSCKSAGEVGLREPLVVLDCGLEVGEHPASSPELISLSHDRCAINSGMTLNQSQVGTTWWCYYYSHESNLAALRECGDGLA